MYRYYINNTLVDEAIGHDRFVTTIKRDRSLRGIVVTQDASISFIGTGYDLLYGYKQTEGFDYTADLLIQRSVDSGSTWKDWHNGKIFISDIEWDEKQKLATTKVVDNGYYARINNNKSVGIPIYGEFSKNNVSITPCTEYDLELFEPSSGTYYTVTRPVGGEKAFTAFKVHDVLRYMVSWMSDGEVGFESTVLDDAGEYGYYALTTGRVIENGDPSIVYSPPFSYPGVSTEQWQQSLGTMTFQDALNNVCKRFNLWWTIVQQDGTTVFKLEKEQYWRDNDNLLTCVNVDGLKCRTNSDLLYGKVAFGQGEVDSSSYLSFPEDIEFIGFKDEELPVVGESNVADNTLDLKTTWVSSSNVIEALLINGLEVDRDFDGKKFIIQCADNAGALQAVQTNNLDSSGAFYYNQSITNAEVSTRFIEAVPNSLALYLGTETGYFVARGDTTGTAINISTAANFNAVIGSNLRFDNDYDGAGYVVPEINIGVLTSATGDPDTVYGAATVQGNPVSLANSYFTAPASGRYGFTAGTVFNWVPYSSVFSATIKLKAWVTDNAGTYLYDVDFGSVIAAPGFNQVAGSVYLNLTSGQRVYVQPYGIVTHTAFSANNSSIQFYSGRFFACTAVATGGGVYQTYDPTAIPIYNYEFDYPVTSDQYDTIRFDLSGKITFSRSGGVQRSGWIEQMKFNHRTQQAKFILASKDR